MVQTSALRVITRRWRLADCFSYSLSPISHSHFLLAVPSTPNSGREAGGSDERTGTVASGSSTCGGDGNSDVRMRTNGDVRRGAV